MESLSLVTLDETDGHARDETCLRVVRRPAGPPAERALGRFGELVGNSAAIRRVFAMLQTAATTDTTVVLRGETGTGKTRAAATLHALSRRAGKPFLVVDCGAMPASLLEAELFGHERGAFTGAQARRTGIFEEADGGTVLLDEVGELPFELQSRLLRVLDERQVRRLGQNRMTPIDVRIIAATHCDLKGAVERGQFRADLYFRLSVLTVEMPPLRDRLEDVPALAAGVLRQLGATPETHPTLFAETFLAGLRKSSWPGNVRELRNFLERRLLFDCEVEATACVQPAPRGRLAEARREVVEAFERQYLTELLEANQGVVPRAAEQAGVNRGYLYRLIRKYGLG